MTHQPPHPHSPNYPALRDFLRGYFHEDLVDEYGSPPQAVARFCADADRDHALAVQREWLALVNALAPQPGADVLPVNQQLHQMGASWRFADHSALTAVSLAFASALSPQEAE